MRAIRRIAIVIILIAGLAYVAAAGFMAFRQRDFQYNAEGPVVPLTQTALTGAADVAIPTSDGTNLAGWYQAASPGKPVILYLKGNSGSFSEENQRFAQFVADGFGFLAFDYRGFPATPGEISEKAILEDALAAFDWLEAKGQDVVVWGRSLGSGPATYLASQRDVGALLLETPFLSAVHVAAERYGFLPVDLLMQDQFHNDRWIADVSEPVMVAHGTGDTTISVSNGEQLYAMAPNPAGLWIVPDAGHGDLWDAGIWAQAKPFLDGAKE